MVRSPSASAWAETRTEDETVRESYKQRLCACLREREPPCWANFVFWALGCLLLTGSLRRRSRHHSAGEPVQCETCLFRTQRTQSQITAWPAPLVPTRSSAWHVSQSRPGGEPGGAHPSCCHSPVGGPPPHRPCHPMPDPRSNKKRRLLTRKSPLELPQPPPPSPTPPPTF